LSSRIGRSKDNGIMKASARLAAASALALTSIALTAVTATAATPAKPAAPTKASGATASADGAVFVQTNDPAGNAVSVLARHADGTLTQAGTYPTGGRGGALGGAAVDHLASQGSLTYDRARHLLYAVNAGSDTVTVFAVSGDRLVRLQQISSGGAFPVSVAVHDGVVYVLNAREGGAVQGFLSVGGFLVRVPGWHRALGLDPAETPEFTSTPGQVGFTPDGDKLVVTTKNNGDAVDVFDIGRFGALSAKPVVTDDPGAVPFSFTFDPAGRLVLTEAGTNALATFSVHSDGKLSLVDRVLTGQAATCWVSTDGTRLFASNAGSGTVSGYGESAGGTLTGGATAATDAGTVDSTVSGDRRSLYVQTGQNGVVDEFQIGAGHSLTRIGSVTVPNSAGGEGIASS
jgi:6-phosphogluconolactonase (cycloisomerase 2 family)